MGAGVRVPPGPLRSRQIIFDGRSPQDRRVRRTNCTGDNFSDLQRILLSITLLWIIRRGILFEATWARQGLVVLKSEVLLLLVLGFQSLFL